MYSISSMAPYGCYSNYFLTVPFLRLFPVPPGLPAKSPFPIFHSAVFPNELIFPRERQTIKELQSETLFHVDMLTIFYPRLFEVVRVTFPFRFSTTCAKCALSCPFSYRSLTPPPV